MKYIIVTISILFFFGALVYQRYLMNGRFQADLQLKISQANEFCAQRQRMYYLQGSYVKLPDFNTLVKDVDGKEIPLMDVLVSSSGVLVYRFTYRMCQECISSEVDRLKKLYRKLGHGSIIILASYNGINDLKVVMKDFNTDIPAYNLPFGTIGEGIDGLDMPYLFYVRSKQVKGSFLFFPEKAQEEWSLQYYKDVINYGRTNKSQAPKNP
ncbi:hypothetical protein [Chitinophaga polysaccharea]|uniref:hypothetical protein n=1 Tax=Chitinophaga polysaccharea TaxID=1293035 RepID=UPI00115A0D35|nr:hypothetical protein [Chitinophaga polysaccharea]